MHKKITATRQAAFLKAVRESGNQTLAAERAKVSRSWVTLHRSRDAGFDAAVREACLDFAGQERERGSGSNRPPRGWGHLDGVELVVRGTGGSALRPAGDGRKGGKRVQIARARLHQWDARVEDRFLETLAATCNVKAACAAVGMTQTSAYNHRKRWRAFAARWDEAEEIGDSRIAAALTAGGINLFSSRGRVSCDTPIPTMTVAEAIHVLAMHQRRTRGIGKRPGRSPREPRIEDVHAWISRKLDAIERERPVSEADKARDRAVYAARRRAA
jgi:hypothetical protein